MRGFLYKRSYPKSLRQKLLKRTLPYIVVKDNLYYYFVLDQIIISGMFGLLLFFYIYFVRINVLISLN